MESSPLLDPLTINLSEQWRTLLSCIGETSLEGISSQEDIIDTLAYLLHDPRYTLLVAQKFQPILIVICARWLDQDGNEDTKLAALGLLVDPHEELFPVLSAFLRKSQLSEGPLAHTSSSTRVSELHLRLLAYYRILAACPHVPTTFRWSPEPILQFILDPHPDTGVRWLSVQCYALHTRMSEARRDTLQLSVLGPAGETDVPVKSGRSLDGQIQWMDGWLLPAFEITRIRDARQAMIDNQVLYQTDGSQESLRIDVTQLTRRVADVHGFLLLKEPSSMTLSSKLISTPSTVNILRTLAVRFSLRLPTLLSSPPSSGKTLLISHLASLLHPVSPNQVITLHLSDTSLDARSLLGSYISSTRQPGAFEWQEGVVVRSMRHGLWLVLEDIDRASSDVLGTLIPLIESLAVHKHIGAPASLDIPGREKVYASENFAIFATRSIAANSDGKLPSPTFLGCSKFSSMDIPAPTEDDLATILHGEFPGLGRRSTRALIRLWTRAKALGSAPGMRNIGVRELETWCRRIDSLLPSTADHDVDMETDEDVSLESIYPHIAVREEMYLEARDVFFGAGAFSESAKAHVSNLARIFAEHLGLSLERTQWVLEGRSPEMQLDQDDDGRTIALRISKTRLRASHHSFDLLKAPQRPFAMHRPALLLTERISTCISLAEPTLLVGETGTGKTTLISHIASLLNRQLVSLNLSHQTESSDLLGGFKPVDTRVPGGELQRRFMDLFGRTFSRRKNSKFEDAVRKAVNENKWKRAVGLWKESMHLAIDKIRERAQGSTVTTQSPSDTIRDPRDSVAFNDDTPRKRRKVDGDMDVREAEWLAFKRDVEVFDIQHVQGKGKFAFGFVEGPLVEALRNGYWVLLDEINLASPETLECISSILQGPTASVILTEQGSFAPVPRHPDFRLFACMNPATDVGKKDLPPNIRSRFTEIHVPPPDADRETLLAIVHQYIGNCALADKSALLDVAEFYMNVKKLAENRELADGSNHRPHFSMRTLARALTFTSDAVATFGLRRALWEGCSMAFSMALDEKSAALVKGLAEKHLLAGVKNMRALMAQVPAIPGGRQAELFERIGPFWLERGSLEPDPASEYILTPSVQVKLVDLARVVLTRRFPVLIEGPTSSGKTSAVEYLARRTGHRFVRVNNHEHTDIQEYLGTYVSDPQTGKLVFHDGILVRALRNGDWIVLDELNLAPTDVLEALNRLLDDNRELAIPETQEVIRPHPHFMLFATQNPPGLYAGRKVLSRAFRNRFLEVHFDDVPQSELQTILTERCRIPDSYAQRIVTVFQELSKRRQAGRVFETKHGFATLRDLFRWAGREASSTQQLAQNGYMLLAERARRPDDKAIVKEVIEAVMKEHIDTDALYSLHGSVAEINASLDVPLPKTSDVVWTSAMKRLFVLVANALKYNEPVLLVGETGSGKTSVCQLFARAASKQLFMLNCHQSTETADLIGGQRPVRNRRSTQAELMGHAREALRAFPEFAATADQTQDVEGMVSLLQKSLKLSMLPSDAAPSLVQLTLSLQQSMALFEWHDGPLIRAMRSGDVFLLDEISLADDSVLERLNSVLEPARNIVLAERGGFDVEHAQVTADLGFKLLATMNPGGDYGKKELSPALRNRFTEIWVPQVETRSDQRMIIHNSWRHEVLRNFTDRVLDFTQWFASAVGERSVVSLRDLLTWVHFANEVYGSNTPVSADILFHHAAYMVFLDGLESSPYTSSWQPGAVENLRERGDAQLELLVPLGEHHGQMFNGLFLHMPDAIHVGAFGIPKGPMKPSMSEFSLQAPTTLDNLRRLVRACQVSKPILLEGSPGVGKTSLVSALGDVSGHRVCRINLSDQTDLMDLFGSDLPVEGGRAGEFAWKDAAFLRAMQDGDWVLLDEMNLAPQAVLEGLNAVLDHRGTVFIPELGRSFKKHPRFRIFAAQNPLYQGGGRKGLPKSFMDRFTKVHIQTLSPDDLLLICQNMFPTLSINHLQSMIRFNSRLHEETMVKRSFGREGSPWEFNLRDVIRWATLLVSSSGFASPTRPSDHLDALYLQRFRTEADRERTIDLFYEVFGRSHMANSSLDCSWASTTPHHVQFGSALIERGDFCAAPNSIELQRHLRPLTAASVCIQEGWLMILSGSAGTGKTQLARYLASASGRHLREFSVSSGVDPTDLLGSFEQSSSDHSVGRFEWIDGPLVEAVKNGYWLLLDNANLCSPSVLDRLNSLCETNGLLVLTERGHVRGEVEVLKPHSHFRLILTLDPRNGELSRAMRNRAVEIHLPATLATLQDKLRICDTVRVPSILGSEHVLLDEIAIQFALLRRGHTRLRQRDLTSVSHTVRSKVVCRDSLTSAILDQTAFSHLRCSDDPHVSAYASMLFSFRMLAPSKVFIFRRLFLALESHHSDQDTPVPSALFDRLAHQRIQEFRHAIGKMVTQIWGVPPSFLSDQPFDFFMNPKLLVEDAESADNLATWQRTLSRAIELFVHVHFFDHTKASTGFDKNSLFHKSRLHSQGYGRDENTTAGLSSIFPLYSSSMELACNVLQALSLEHCGEQSALLGFIKHLIDLAEHMREYSNGSHFDFTSARVISAWFDDVLATNATLLASPVAIHARKLANEVSITSGHGMQEIWRNLIIPGLEGSIHLAVNRLDHLAANLDPSLPSFSPLRSDTFNAMALLTLDTYSSNKERESIIVLCSDLEQRLVSHGEVHNEEILTSRYSAQLAVAELDVISSALRCNFQRISRRRGDLLFGLASQTAGASLAQFTHVQHHLWKSDIHGAQFPGRLASLASMIRLWMSALNNISPLEHSSNASCGPDVLLKPILLQEIVTISRHDQALNALDSYERALQLQGKLAANRCQEEPVDRMGQIFDIWKGVLLVLAECFKETYPPDTIRALQQATFGSESSQQCNDLVEQFANSTNVHLSRIVRDRLMPSSHRLDRCHKGGSEWTSSLGKAWISLGFTVLELYVPDIPLDPVATQRCASNFWKRREVEIMAQAGIHASAEKMITGNENNPLLTVLQHQLDQVHAKLGDSADSLTSRDVNVGTLHALFGEITQFLDQVVKSSKFDVLVNDLDAAREDSQSRALMVQATISGFISRLGIGYPQYADIVQPISMALTFLSFGLHFLGHALRSRAANPQTIRTLRNFVSFPAMVMVDSVRADDSSKVVSSPQLSLQLIASAYDIGLQGPRATSFGRLDDTNDKLTKLWLEDRDQEKRELEESQSLYRPKRLDHDMQSDAQIEEQDFRQMFPTFEDPEAEHAQDGQAASLNTGIPSKGLRLTASDMERIGRLNLWIMGRPNSGGMDDLRNEYHELRNSWVRDTLDSHFSWFPQGLDAESLPYQVLLVSNAMAELNGHRPMKRGAYSFYHDPNIPEVKKAVFVVRTIQERLRELLKEWPDQMVLQHLLARCEALLKLHLHSPIAKVLSGLEQLLLQTEDWEIYSNRENTLKPQQANLSGLIVEWRRLELTCWSQLLESQAHASSDGAAEWWFRLYELIVRGTLAAAVEGSTSVDAYFMEMIPLVEQFVTVGPLGQYMTRMRLLKSFSQYTGTLSTTKDMSGSEALARASRILQSLYSFYDQFGNPLLHSLAERRAILEKEISDYIKLASWKDVNVHALKQSAQRTHRQLYKCVRKFRELLREPIAPFLSYKAPEAAIDTSHLPEKTGLTFHSLDATSPPVFPSIAPLEHTQPHLLDLPRTFSKFKNLLKSHGQPLVNAVSFAFVDDLARQIADTVAALSAETNNAGSNTQLHKTLIMRKRKAWIDLLQELKRAGLSSRLKPETLERQQNQVWLMDRQALTPSGDSPIFDIASKGESYLNRMLHLMPELRRSLASHHGDLPTRELQRAITFVESSFSLALSTRARLAKDYLLFSGLDRTTQRLRTLSATQGVIITACDVLPWLDLCYRLLDALDEVSKGCLRLVALEDTLPLLPEVLDAISAQSVAIGHSRQSLSTLCDSLDATHKGFMVPEECDIFEKACTSIMSTKAALRDWMVQEPRIRHLCDPVLVWFTSTSSKIKNLRTEELQSTEGRHENVIDRLLVIVQGLLTSSASPRPSDDDLPLDNYALGSERVSDSISRILALETVAQAVTSFADGLTVVVPSKRVAMIQNMLPFIDTYLRLVHNHLLVQAQLAKSFLKLSFILCCVVLSLSTKGFCKPPAMEEESQTRGNDGAEISEGTGLGQGTGLENVSNQIEDESQVEGTRGEETAEEQPGDDTADDNGIEMDDNFDGELGDIDGDNEETSDGDSQLDAEDQVGKVDGADPDAVDEKLWGNENAAGETPEEKATEDGRAEQNQESEMVAKENQEKGPPSSGGDDKEGGQMDEDVQETADSDQDNANEMPDEQPIDAGKQMDDFVPEANTLDLPENLNLDAVEDEKDDDPSDDGLMDEDGPEPTGDTAETEFVPEEPEKAPVSPQDESRADKEDDKNLHEPPQSEQEQEAEELDTTTVGQPDISAGDEEQVGDPTARDSLDPPTEVSPRDSKEAAGGSTGTTAGREDAKEDQTFPQGRIPTSAAVPPREELTGDQAPDTTAAVGTTAESAALPNPLRSLGDTLKEIRRRFDQIGDATEPQPLPSMQVDDTAESSQVEYLQEGQEDYDLQALGPARDDQVAKLNELRISEEESTTRNEFDHLDIHEGDMEPQNVRSQPEAMRIEAGADKTSRLGEIEDAITDSQVRSERPDNAKPIHSPHDESAVTADIDMAPMEEEPEAEQLVEFAVKQWQETGHSDARSAEMWRLYDSLTQDLSFALCEQLRLILEPTLATRLRGDYRTGKRLNMKKIIPYIASEYTKDKIWLRRTRPSQREYQVLIALDDSRSMAESRSIHLAYQTLALVSKALNRLESGEVAIARFGESVEMVHGFEEGMVGDRAGEKIMRQFTFAQRKTDVLGLVEASLKVLTQARERRAMGRASAEAADLWQLEIIISDGICQDHDKLRTVLRKAEEQRVMIVFVVVDSLHAHHIPSASDEAGAARAAQNSILSMNQVSYKDAGGGRMELQMMRYLDSFPFQYYVVLRNVDALPDVLSGTLKQFFERISEE